ncbi:GNAT family N-acetyltransferase [Streptomyces sp. WAC05374]|uniref:GNAT family N-acetyltransferase n=1 Tax=Streptomyces sp. WAC05374 TaxID=2487420 RepID=UPI000F85FA2E|nr:GNAT family N-acetyltransferase [Streptomyces sp. WAC05374]RST12735.1 GNAT family N-acetyltransferase [Streptomyces sp. WAC05374]TDF50549.1 GNAT family N-acetyltransferase [Streptomyces sp. WAC05374]TDF56838.1 GNAT family N-acetyltransferase [Streptomyces sp. WAC05374]TDF60801.1 GNAT family N-acetyltransferase [Streptomyces sp. WAC05374]
MTTATPRLVAPPSRLLALAPPLVRAAHAGDAAALEALSRPFVRSGALRERPRSLYAADAADFLVAEGPDGTLEGCLGLRVHRSETAGDRGPTGVLYNFCVAPHRQGRGVGRLLMRAALARAAAQSLSALFTATTGGGDLFLRCGFTPAGTRPAPTAWVDSLDPRRNSRILVRAL